MKPINLLIALLISFHCIAQDVEKSFVPYYLTNENVEDFERIGSKIEVKAIGFGYGGANQYLTVFNSKHSPLRFKMGSMPKFIIKLDEGTDPLDLVIISKADVVKKRKTYRRFVKEGYAMGGAKDMSKYLTIPKLKLFDESQNLYEMIFDEPLQPGEYAFQPIYKGKEAVNIMSTNNMVRIYCFGIDE